MKDGLYQKLPLFTYSSEAQYFPETSTGSTGNESFTLGSTILHQTDIFSQAVHFNLSCLPEGARIQETTFTREINCIRSYGI